MSFPAVPNIGLANVHRPAENAVALDRTVKIPRKPAAPEPIQDQHVNGISGPEPTTGKRKRDAEDAGLVNGEERVKRVAGMSADGDDTHPIVLDEDGGGVIMIED